MMPLRHVLLTTASAILFTLPAAPQQAPADNAQLAKEVGHKLLGLTNYAVFDSLSFKINGHTVTLEGYASRPVLKDDAQNAVKQIPGVESVDNQIKVLPLSPNDDRIRFGVYRRVYGYPALRKYSSGGPVFDDSLAIAAGGITQDPPLGYHAIHIIVDNGQVTLTGVVDSKGDADIAYLQANQTPGAFSVKNDLRVAGQHPEQAAR